jgi:hypothetical protein
MVAHACNPSYSGGRDQGDRGLKPAWAKSSWDPISKNASLGKEFMRPYLQKTLHKKGLTGVAQGRGLEFRPQYHKKKKN